MDPVIIVGAGPVGLALSLALARQAVPSVVLDDRPGEGEEGADADAGDAADSADAPRLARTVVLRPRTAAFLARLGCADALAQGARWTGWRVRRGGRTQAEADFGAGDSPLHIAQSALTTALAGLVEASKHAELFRGSRLEYLEQEPRGINARTRTGTWWRGSWLVGCDGARSTVRKLLEVPFTGRTSVERQAVAVLRTDLPWAPGEAVLHRGSARSGHGAETCARPLGGGLWRVDWLLPARGGLVTPESLISRIQTTLGAWTGARSADQPPSYELLDTGVYAAHHRLARQWRRGRALLAGDAAHLVGALGMQQLDEGLADAENLAWKLGRVWHDGRRDGSDAAEALVDSYEAERRGVVSHRLRAADQALPLLRPAGGWRSVLRGGAAAELLTDGHLGRGALGGPPVYDPSPLAPPSPLEGAVEVGTPAGGQVADVPVTAPDGWSGPLADRLGGEPLVVLVAPGTRVWDRARWLQAGLMPQLVRAVEALPVRTQLLVAEGYPGAAPHTVLCVRPDGHLLTAVAGVRPAALHACAERLTA